MSKNSGIDYAALHESLRKGLEDFRVEQDKKAAKLVEDIKRGNFTKCFTNDNQVPDVWRRTPRRQTCTAEIVKKETRSVEKSRFIDINTDNILTNQQGHLKLKSTVVLLLESPHRKEYDSGGQPIAPAQDVTGKNIHRLMSIDDTFHNRHSLVICNPIQWQTSLSMIHNLSLSIDMVRDLRNIIWISAWNSDGVKAHFLNRLSRYGPVLVINACTKSIKCRGHKCASCEDFESFGCLRGYVQKEIGANYTTIQVGHPSSWIKKETRHKVHYSITEKLQGYRK